ncbi:hypothetical protein TNCV_2400821 [Trichonephila clavipes]|nr:hypothetical protein TNCV_2400821 [Trichonephila clavipes]
MGSFLSFSITSFLFCVDESFVIQEAENPFESLRDIGSQGHCYRRVSRINDTGPQASGTPTRTGLRLRKGGTLTGSLTFSELSSLKKIGLNQLRITAPSHPWYFGRNPEGSSRLMRRKYQTTFSRFVSGHIKALTFRQGQKVFPECLWCYSELVSPASILTFGFYKRQGRPSLLFFGISRIFQFMGRFSSITEQSGIRNNNDNLNVYRIK